MTYLIIEHFRPNKVKALYHRFAEKGRLLPEGVTYLNSWIDENVKTCYQLMESESLEKLKLWISHWDDLADFEIVPVINSAEAKAKVFAKSDSSNEFSIQIRIATEADCVAISKLLFQAFEAFEKDYTKGGFAATTISPEEVKSRIAKGIIWLAILNNKIVGTVSTFKNENTILIKSMAVHPDARGKKIGLQLLQQVENHAIADGAKYLYLNTTPYLKKAIRLYEKFGFEIINEPPYELFGTPLFNMRKKL